MGIGLLPLKENQDFAFFTGVVAGCHQVAVQKQRGKSCVWMEKDQWLRAQHRAWTVG